MALAAIVNSTQDQLKEEYKILVHMVEEEGEDEEEEFFEIDLEIVNNIPPPHYWESYFTAATSSTLLANCLLPISDVSCAIPAVAKASGYY
uniref:Uncharacterized protein LOC104246635 n=1 Tax=Nicotiana sylvestris TaxID=4096 RepID=A0A1U7YFR4_NICSY|nr:PREDICTED: uncharacterized protein LOC104246635 [Nicotiana sylvestris]